MIISINKHRSLSISKSGIPITAALLIFYRRAISVIGRSLFGIDASTTMMIVYVYAVVSFILWRIKSKSIKPPNSLVVLVIMAVFYIVSLILTPNDAAYEYFREYLIYCVAGGIIISHVDEFEMMIKRYCSFSLIIFVFCAPLPFVTGTFRYHNMGYFVSGMVYGEWVILPCFFGLFLLNHYYQKKWAVILEVIDLVLMVLFANRSSLLSVAFFIILYDFMILNQIGKRVVGKWIAITILALVTYFYLESIIIELQRVLGIYDISSRALTKYLAFFQEGDVDISYILSGRDSITTLALNCFKESPWLGIGVGSFSMKTGVVYTHNLVTDALSTFGLLGGSVILIITIVAIIQSIKKRDDKVLVLLLVLLLVQSFPRLLFSKTFVNDVPYWMFVVFSLSHYIRVLPSHVKN